MSNAAVEKIVEEILAPNPDLSVLASKASELDSTEMQDVFSLIREKALEASSADEISLLARITGGMLLYWAVAQGNGRDDTGPVDADIAAAVATAAADIFVNDLDDSEYGDIASVAAAVLGLEPEGLAWVWERYGSELDEDSSVRILKLLAGCGDAEYNRRYGPALGEILAKRRERALMAESVENDPVEDESVEDAPAEEEPVEDAPDDPTEVGTDSSQAELFSQAPGQADDDNQARDDEPVENDAVGDVPDAPVVGDLATLKKTAADSPRDRGARRAFIALAVEQGEVEQARAFLKKHLPGLHDSDKAAALLDLAWLQETGVGDDVKALTTLEQAIDIDPESVQALDAYLELAKKSEQMERAAGFLETVRRSVTATDSEKPILKILGGILAELGKDGDAEKIWRRLRSLEPRNVAALEFYVAYYGRRNDWKKQFDTAQFMLSVVDDDARRVELNRLMADIAENHLNNLDRAAEAYKRILAITPADTVSFEALVALYEKSRKWHPLVEMYNDRIRRMPVDDIDGKVALLFRIVEIYQNPDKQPSQENMLAAYSRIADISPTNIQALQTLEVGYQKSERWPELLKILQKKIEMTEDPVELLELFNRVAEIAVDRMSNETQAIPFLEKILELDPENLDVVHKLKSIYSHKLNLEKHYQMLRREIDMTTGAEREKLLLTAAKMARDRLLRHEEALELYEMAYAANGTLREARENMHALYNRLERWGDYAVFLDSEVECQMPDRRRIELLHKLAEIRTEFLNDPVSAEKIYTKILSFDPADDLAAARLEASLLAQGRFAEILEIYRGRKEIRKFVVQLSQFDQLHPDSPDRKELNLILARVCESDLKEPDRALEFLAEAFFVDPSDEPVGRRVVSLAQKRKDIERVEKTLRVLARNGTEPKTVHADWLKVAGICADRGRASDSFDSTFNALKAWFDPDKSPAIVDEAIQTATRAALWQPLADLLEYVTGLEISEDWRQALLMNLGDVFGRRLGRHAKAVEAFEQILSSQPDNLDALDALESIALQTEDYKLVESVLRRRIDAVSTPEEQHPVYMKLGSLFEDLLGDDESAAEAFDQAARLSDNKDRAVLAGLHRTLDRLERYEELADVIELERLIVTSDWALQSLEMELATVLSDGLGRHDDALVVLDRLLESGDNERALALVLKIFESGAGGEACTDAPPCAITETAGSILQSVYRRNGDAKGLIGVIETMISRTTRQETLAALHVTAAGIRMTELGDDRSAFSDAVASVTAFPTDENVQLMLSLAERTEMFPEAADALEKYAVVSDDDDFDIDPRLEAVMARALGDIYSNRLGNVDGAIAAYERALPAWEDDPELLGKMLALYRSAGNVDSALVSFDRLSAVQADQERRGTLIAMALFASENDRVDIAVETLAGIQEQEFDPEADSLLEEILFQHGRYAELIKHLEQKCDMPRHAEARSEICHRIADLYLDQMHLPGLAAKFVSLSLLAPGAQPQVLEMAEKMALDRSLGDRASWAPALIDLVTATIEQAGGGESRIVELLRAGVDLCSTAECKDAMFEQIVSKQSALGDISGSFDTLSLAIENMPGKTGLLQAFLEAAEASDAWLAARDRLLRISEELPSVDARSGISFRLAAADIASKRLHDLQDCVAICKKLHADYPDNMEIALRLDAALGATGQNSERIPLQDRIAGLADTIEQKREFRLGAASLASDTGDFVAAAGFYDFVLDNRPDADSLDELAIKAGVGLVDASIESGDFKTAAETHTLLGKLIDDPDIALGHLHAAGLVIRDMARDPESALPVFIDIIERYPDDKAARDAARELAEQTADVGVLLSLLEDDAKRATDDSSRIAAWSRIADVCVRSDVSEPGRALDSVEKILRLEPDNAAAVATARGMLDVSDIKVRTAEILVDAAGRSGDDDLLVVGLQALLDDEKDLQNQVTLLHRIGDACVRRERGDDAVSAFGRAWVLNHLDSDSLRKLSGELNRQSRIARIGDWVDLACESSTECSASDMTRIRLSAASEVMETAGDASVAFELLRKALLAAPGNSELIDVMLDVAEKGAMWLHFVETLRHRIDTVVMDDDERADAWLRCASVYQDPNRLADPDSAAECYREVLAIRPLDQAAIVNLSQILQESGDTEGLRIMWHCELTAIEKTNDPADADRAATLRRDIAQSALSEGALDDAVSMARRIVEIDSDRKSSVELALKVHRETFDASLFDELFAKLEAAGDHRRLLDLCRLVYAKGDVHPGPEVCLRKAVELDEKLRLHDFRFEDLGRLVNLVPDDREVRATYLDVGRKLGRMTKVFALLERTFTANQDGDVAFELAMEIAEILQKDLEKPEDAAGYLRIAFLRRPDDEEIVVRLAGIYTTLKRFGELALLYENLGDLKVDPNERVLHYFQAAEVAVNDVGEPEAAVEIYKKVLDVDPGNLAAVDALIGIARNSDDPVELAVWIGHKADIIDSPDERRNLRLELAGLFTSRLERAQDAISIYEGLLEDFPTDPDLWSLLEKVLIASGAFERLADSYMRLAGVVTDDELRIANWKKAAAVYESKLEDRFSAMAALEEILSLDPVDNFACVRLSDLLEASGEWERLSVLLDTRLKNLSAEDDRTALALRLAGILVDRLGRPADAVELFRIALEADPSLDVARKGLSGLMGDNDYSIDAALILEDVYRKTGEYDALVDVQTRELSMLHTPRERAAVLMRMADVFLTGLDSPDKALSTVGKALAETPGNRDVLKSLALIADKADLWREAYGMAVEAMKRSPEIEATATLAHFAGDVAFDRISDMKAAVGHYETVLKADVGDQSELVEILRRLDRAYGELGRKTDRIQVMKRLVDIDTDEFDADLHLRLARCLMEDSVDVDTAFELAKTVLKKEPANQEALSFITDIAGDPIVGRRAMYVLRRAFKESRNDAELLRAVENQILNSHETAELVELHTEAAGAAAALGSPERELTHLGAALALDPSNENLLEKTLKSARSGANGRLAWAVLNRAAQAASWPDLEKKLLLDAVELCNKIGDIPAGDVEVALVRVLELDPSNRTALDLLDTAYGEQNRIDDQIRIIRHRLRLNLTAKERARVLTRLGDLLEKTGQVSAAAETFEEICLLDACDLDLLNRLKASYVRLEDVPGQIRTIERMANASGDRESRLSRLMEIAELQYTKGDDPRAAIATLERLISEDPLFEPARLMLEDIYEVIGDFETLVRLLTGVVDSDLPVDERVRCALKAASITENELDNVAGAITLARQASVLQPDSTDILDELTRLYYKAEDWIALVSVIRKKAATVSDSDTRVQMLGGAVQIAVENVDDHGLAAMIAREILEVEPDHPDSLLMLARDHEGRQEDEQALELFTRLKADGFAGDIRIEGLLGTARLLTKLERDPELVQECLKEAAALNPDHPSVNQFLKQSYMTAGNFPKVIDCLRQELEDAASDSERASIAMDIAEIHLSRLDSPEGFLEFANLAYGYRRDDPRVVAGLADFHLDRNNHEEAERYLEWLVNYLEAKRMLRDLPRYAGALARILEERGDTRRAVDFYRICHEHDSTDAENTLALGRLHQKHNELEKALRVLQPMLLRIDSLELLQKKEVLLSLARINEGRGDLKKARQFVNRLLTEVPDCAEAREMLSRL